MHGPTLIYDFSKMDFEKPGKHHYQVAFHHDSSWGYSLVPLTVINGLKKLKAQSPGAAIFGGTHGNEWEGQVTVKRLCHDLDPAEMSGRVILVPQLSESACVANTRISPRRRQHEPCFSRQSARLDLLSDCELGKDADLPSGARGGGLARGRQRRRFCPVHVVSPHSRSRAAR